jgi:DNA-binding NtrC family response regulator
MSLDEHTDVVKKTLVKFYLEQTRGNVQATARQLEVSKKTVYRLIEKFGLDLTEYRDNIDFNKKGA